MVAEPPAAAGNAEAANCSTYSQLWLWITLYTDDLSRWDRVRILW